MRAIEQRARYLKKERVALAKTRSLYQSRVGTVSGGLKDPLLAWKAREIEEVERAARLEKTLVVHRPSPSHYTTIHEILHEVTHEVVSAEKLSDLMDALVSLTQSSGKVTATTGAGEASQRMAGSSLLEPIDRSEVIVNTLDSATARLLRVCGGVERLGGEYRDVSGPALASIDFVSFGLHMLSVVAVENRVRQSQSVSTEGTEQLARSVAVFPRTSHAFQRHTSRLLSQVSLSVLEGSISDLGESLVHLIGKHQYVKIAYASLLCKLESLLHASTDGVASRELLGDIHNLLTTFVNLWKEYKEDLKRQEQEKEDLYRHKTVTHSIATDEEKERELTKEFEEMFKSFEDFEDMKDDIDESFDAADAEMDGGSGVTGAEQESSSAKAVKIDEEWAIRLGRLQSSVFGALYRNTKEVTEQSK